MRSFLKKNHCFSLFFSPQDECQNYIRVLAATDTSSLLVCGTNSFKPKCRTYTTIREETPKIENKNQKSQNKSRQNATITAKTTTAQPTLIDDGILRLKHEFSGTGICPLDPRHNSTAIFTGKFKKWFSVAYTAIGGDLKSYLFCFDKTRCCKLETAKMLGTQMLKSMQQQTFFVFQIRKFSTVWKIGASFSNALMKSGIMLTRLK